MRQRDVIKVHLCNQTMNGFCRSATSTDETVKMAAIQVDGGSSYAWELPIGFYMTSSFNFTVGANDDQCDVTSDTYNFRFHRDCTVT
jgi:hypothetical protein